MIATIILGILAISFAYLSRYKNTNWGLKVSFFLIFLFLALRYNFGNDYETYLRVFTNAPQDNQIDYNYFLFSFYDPGWLLLNWLFRHLGFFAMTAVLGFLNCFIYYRFFKKYVPVKYYWFAIFLYIFYPGFMLIHSTAMRQSIAVMLFVFSLDYLYKRQAIRYFICIGFASLFHYTALILLTVYLITFLNQKIRINYGVFFVSVYGLLYLFGQTLTPYLKEFISAFSEKYEFYQDKGPINSGLGIIYYSTLFILVLYSERMQKREVALVFKIAILSFLIMPLMLIIQMFGRLIMYFAPATIIAYPNILMNFKKPMNKIIFSTFVIVFTIYQFFQFFYSDTYQNYFMNYQTIFSAPKWQ